MNYQYIKDYKQSSTEEKGRHLNNKAMKDQEQRIGYKEHQE